MSDPIDLPGFNPMRKREPNPERMARIRELAARIGVLREALHQEIREAKAAGHSYPQLAEAAGVSIGVIQRIVAPAV